MNTTTRKTFKTVIAAATLAAAFATGAHAADVAQVRVSYADLNLHSSAGNAILNRRIKWAAEQVCGGSGDRDLARRTQVNACTNRAVAEALAAVKTSEIQLASAK